MVNFTKNELEKLRVIEKTNVGVKIFLTEQVRGCRRTVHVQTRAKRVHVHVQRMHVRMHTCVTGRQRGAEGTDIDVLEEGPQEEGGRV